ncbi:hypothetical protein ACFZDG_35840 [Kitasatospora xanthocidica]|uniref:hypothetical protein n=1 Tax=Kitasatospora xanthocidica TaxID=83382 RepID=UPI0036E06D93
MIGAPNRHLEGLLRETLTTMGVAVFTTVVTTMVMSRVTPRTERWGLRYKAAVTARDGFRQAMESVMATVPRLQTAPRADGSNYAQRLEAEWERWRGRIDEATRVMLDDSAPFVLTYTHRLGVHRQLAGYIVLVRAVWLSDLPEEDRLRLVRGLTEHAHSVFFPSRWHPLRFATAREQLDVLLEEVTGLLALPGEPAVDELATVTPPGT